MLFDDILKKNGIKYTSDSIDFIKEYILWRIKNPTKPFKSSFQEYGEDYSYIYDYLEFSINGTEYSENSSSDRISIMKLLLNTLESNIESIEYIRYITKIEESNGSSHKYITIDLNNSLDFKLLLETLKQ